MRRRRSTHRRRSTRRLFREKDEDEEEEDDDDDDDDDDEITKLEEAETRLNNVLEVAHVLMQHDGRMSMRMSDVVRAGGFVGARLPPAHDQVIDFHLLAEKLAPMEFASWLAVSGGHDEPLLYDHAERYPTPEGITNAIAAGLRREYERREADGCWDEEIEEWVMMRDIDMAALCDARALLEHAQTTLRRQYEEIRTWLINEPEEVIVVPALSRPRAEFEALLRGTFQCHFKCPARPPARP